MTTFVCFDKGKKKSKKETPKKKGEFTEQKKLNKRRAEIYTKINLACKEAEEKGTAIVEVDNRRFYLASDERASCDFYLVAYAFLRLNRFGLVFCEVCEKDRGWQQTILPAIGSLNLSHTTVSKKLAAWVLKVEDINTGEILFFDPKNTYYSQETEDSWWVKLRNRTTEPTSPTSPT